MRALRVDAVFEYSLHDSFFIPHFCWFSFCRVCMPCYDGCQKNMYILKQRWRWGRHSRYRFILCHQTRHCIATIDNTQFTYYEYRKINNDNVYRTFLLLFCLILVSALTFKLFAFSRTANNVNRQHCNFFLFEYVTCCWCYAFRLTFPLRKKKQYVKILTVAEKYCYFFSVYQYHCRWQYHLKYTIRNRETCRYYLNP